MTILMAKHKRQNEDILELPNYSPIEASRYFHIHPSTLTYWTSGQDPLVKLSSVSPRLLSFKNLVELYVLEGLRSIHGLHLQAIRTAVEYLLEHEYSAHPLADFELSTLNKRYIVFRREGSIVNSSLSGQYEIPEWTTPYLRRVDRDVYGNAHKIFPFLKRSQITADAEPPKAVVIDPKICFGLPVLSGSRITTGFLASRYRGGDSISAIARSYDRPVAEIEEAIEWETGKKIGQQAA
jgi:uncharacterized protein (DUF433 family)